jgi:hypothetical protein
VKAARLVETMGGSIIEVPLAAVLNTRLEALSAETAGAADAQDIKALTQRYVEPPLGWSMSQEVRHGMDQTLDNEAGGLAQQFRYLETALGGGSIPPCDPS